MSSNINESGRITKALKNLIVSAAFGIRLMSISSACNETALTAQENCKKHNVGEQLLFYIRKPYLFIYENRMDFPG